jgi:hypothetical protein
MDGSGRRSSAAGPFVNRFEGNGRMRISRIRSIVVASVVAAISAIGCQSIVGLGDFSVKSRLNEDASVGVQPPGEDAAAGEDASCTEPTAFGGRGCFRCSPMTAPDLRNACTSAECTPFDNEARIPGYVAGAPRREATPAAIAPAPEAGAPVDAGGGTVADGGAGSGRPKCSELLPRPVYLYGSSALNLGLRTLSQAISAKATIVYQYDTSCPGLDAILTGITRLKGVAQYWPPGQDQPLSCDVEGEQSADIGLCDVAPESCIPNFPGSPNLVDDSGPAQVFMFSVPKGSTQKSISAEAAYSVFAYDDAGVEPWVDPSSLVRRGPGSGVQLTIAASLDLLPQFWRGVIKAKSSELKPGLLAVATPEKALGITSADVAEEADARANLRTLAYQHYGQSCAFTPDSSVGSSDKRNVRDGHYELWAPYHFYTRGQNGRTQDPFIAEIVSYLTGAKALPNRNTDFITTLKQAGLVPTCAMHVTRAREGARLVPFHPSPSCSCYFDASPPGGVVPAGCKSCATSAECPSTAPNCNFNYCEP